jgi:2',3'-cyclic-nucleotide 2'-phosphodiesterase (5'-nucleotidase family)/predicted AlkP superfamily phosphohydrolase/phosphomutase
VTALARRIAPVAALALVVALLVQTQPFALAAGGSSQFPLGQRMIFFASDGMRPDYVDKYADVMPTYNRIKREGTRGDNGMLSQAPPNTGAGWTTMITGAWPGVTGAQNNTFHKVGDTILTRARPYDYAEIGAETLAEVAEKSGKKVAMLEWVASLPTPRIKGPVVEFNNQYSGRGILANYEVPGVNQALAKDLGLIDNRVTLADASGWTGAPESFSPAKQTELLISTSVASGTQQLKADFRYNIYIFDSTNDGKTNYDRVAIATDQSKNLGGAQRVILGPQQWGNIKLQLPQEKAPGNRLAGFYVKTVDLAPDLSRFRLYFTNVQRGRARWIEREPAFNLEDYIAVNFPTYVAADFGPIEAGLVDDATYVEQGLMWQNYTKPVSEYLMREYNPDVLFAGFPTTDEFSHQYMALATPGLPVSGHGDPKQVARYDGYIKLAYQGADQTLGALLKLMGSNTAVFAGADHGFAPHYKGINANQVLADAGLLTFDANGRVNPDAKAVAYSAGGAANIYINLAGRERAIPIPNASPAANYPQVARGDYEKVRQQIVDAFAALRDADGANPIGRILRKEETRNLVTEGVTQHLLHPTRTGDVVVFAQPPYQYDAAEAGKKLSDVPFYGQHGYMPDLVDLKRNINMHAAFYAWGPNINRGVVKGMTVVDMAPSAAFYLGIQAPEQAEGNVRLDLFRLRPQLKQVSLSTVSDFHGQIQPTTTNVDGQTVDVGGLAYIKTLAEEDARRDGVPHILATGGDSIGATPLISAFKGDFPTIEAMNAANFTFDGIGNHNYDAGQQHMAEIAAAARFPFLSANTVFADSGRPVPWAKPSIMLTLNGVKVGVVGVTNPEAPTLVSPTAVQNLKFTDPAAAVQAEAPKLRRAGAQVVMAVFHGGAEQYTASKDPYFTKGNPEGPGIDLAEALDPGDIDVLIADHTNVKVRAVVNDILVVENLSKGVTFSDIDIYVDPSGGVVYTTGKVRPAWNQGVVPDPAVKAVVDKYAEEIKPIFNEVVGESAALITRSRGAESLMGNLVTDAIRAKYGAQIALQNSGGLRADIDVGPVTYGEVFNVLPFGNQSATVRLTGRLVLAALENGVGDVSGSAGRFIQVSGVYFTYDPSKPAGQRVVAAFLDKARTQPLDPNATYLVVTNDFMLQGGDNYTMLAQGTDKATRDLLVNDVVEYVRANRPINPQLEGRIQVAGR